MRYNWNRNGKVINLDQSEIQNERYDLEMIKGIIDMD